VRRALQLDRAGHAGTLDPFATGLLVCLTGRATRIADLVQAGHKVYSGQFKLGVVTDTDDSTGKVLTQTSALPIFEQSMLAAKNFVGKIQQVPPQISAVKIDGKRAYARARAGEAFEISKRAVEVFEFTLRPTSEPDLIAYFIKCSKGTYIRALARDLGQVLGCGACVHSLRREQSGKLEVANACPLDQVAVSMLKPWDSLLPEIPRLAFSLSQAKKIWMGRLDVLQEVSRQIGFELNEGERFIYALGDAGPAYGLLRVQAGELCIEANIVEPL
jgi:tRNA pseudouridine55 synthase